jgi:hypothetical protein
MKNKLSKPTRSPFSILRQICNFIPAHTVSKIARETGVQEQARTFQPWSHVVAAIHIVDTTVMELVANCMDWAKHRRRKAAAQTHMRLNLQSLLPEFVIVDIAAEHDNKRAREVCAGLHSGEIALFDKGFLDFEHLRDLDQRGVFWVSRAKENMDYSLVRKMPPSTDTNVLRDEIIVLNNQSLAAPELMRRVVARVEVGGEEREMTFLTNNLEWIPVSVAALYKCRWQIEVFFKQIKQTLQLADFLGHNANAVRWQVWTALLTYVLLRYLSYLSKWAHSFTRLLTILRAALWRKFDLLDLLARYGQQAAAFAIWPAPTKPISRASNLWDSTRIEMNTRREKTKPRQNQNLAGPPPPMNPLKINHPLPDFSGCGTTVKVFIISD